MAKSDKFDVMMPMALASGAGALTAQFALGAASVIGQDIGNVVRELRNRARADGWQKAILAQEQEVQTLLDDLDSFRQELARHPKLVERAVRSHIEFSCMLDATADMDAIQAYEALEELAVEVRHDIAHIRAESEWAMNAFITDLVRQQVDGTGSETTH